MLKIRRPLGRLIFNMGIAIPGKTVFLIETAPWYSEFRITGSIAANGLFDCCLHITVSHHSTTVMYWRHTSDQKTGDAIFSLGFNSVVAVKVANDLSWATLWYLSASSPTILLYCVYIRNDVTMPLCKELSNTESSSTTPRGIPFLANIHKEWQNVVQFIALYPLDTTRDIGRISDPLRLRIGSYVYIYTFADINWRYLKSSCVESNLASWMRFCNTALKVT